MKMYEEFLKLTKIRKSVHFVKASDVKSLTMFHKRRTDLTTRDKEQITATDKIKYARLEMLRPLKSTDMFAGLNIMDFLMVIAHATTMAKQKPTMESLELLVNIHKGNLKEAQPFLDAIWLVANTFYSKYRYDLKMQNVMMRGDIPVITDPFNDYADWVKTKAFMVYQEPRHLDGAINVVTGRAKHDSN